MTDLTFGDLQAEQFCPNNSFLVMDNKLYCDIGTLIGESVASAESGKVAEFAFKLARIGRLAQLTKNANNGSPLPVGNQVNSFDNPIFSSPTYNSSLDTIATSGTITIRVSYSVNANDALTNNV